MQVKSVGRGELVLDGWNWGSGQTPPNLERMSDGGPEQATMVPRDVQIVQFLGACTVFDQSLSFMTRLHCRIR